MTIISEWELPDQRGLRGIVMHNPDYAEALLPSERFSDEYASDAEFFESRTEYDDPAGRGAHSKALKMRMASISAGWETPSSGEELHAAIHAGEPDDRQIAVIRSWEAETDEHEIFEAFLEQAYSFKALAAALHRAGLERCKSAAFMNQFAANREDGDG